VVKPEDEEKAPVAGNEIAEALAMYFLPDEVREQVDGRVDGLALAEPEISPLLRQGLRQAGIGRLEVAMLELQFKVQHLENKVAHQQHDVERVERDQSASITEGRVFAISITVTTVLIGAAGAIGQALFG
jgi:hypothetical protein